jgi:putative phosphoesterase
MKIGIISDTHDNIFNIKKVVNILHQEKVDMVLHAGDFVAPMTLSLYKGLPFVGIFGNNDGDKFRLLSQAAKNGLQLAGDIWEQVIDDLSMIMYHGTEKQIVDALISCQKYDVVVYGHTHQHDIRTVGKTLAINPGTVHGFEKQATFVLFDTTKREAKLENL